MNPRTLDSVVRRNVPTDWLLVTLSGMSAAPATGRRAGLRAATPSLRCDPSNPEAGCRI
jgi:hypothetical protein